MNGAGVSLQWLPPGVLGVLTLMTGLTVEDGRTAVWVLWGDPALEVRVKRGGSACGGRGAMCLRVDGCGQDCTYRVFWGVGVWR